MLWNTVSSTPTTVIQHLKTTRLQAAEWIKPSSYMFVCLFNPLNHILHSLQDTSCQLYFTEPFIALIDGATDKSQLLMCWPVNTSVVRSNKIGDLTRLGSAHFSLDRKLISFSSYRFSQILQETILKRVSNVLKVFHTSNLQFKVFT